MNKSHCAGCREDFYNRSELAVDGKCWMRDEAKIVTRYRTGTWTMPLSPRAFAEVRVPNCYRQTGVVFTDRPHPEAVDVVRLKRPPR